MGCVFGVPALLTSPAVDRTGLLTAHTPVARWAGLFLVARRSSMSALYSVVCLIVPLAAGEESSTERGTHRTARQPPAGLSL